MTKNKDPMLQELGTLINNRTATQKALVPFNEQAQFLIENALDLIKQVLVKHSAAVLEEMRDHIVARNTRIAALESENEALREDAERWRMLPAFLEKHQINYVMLLRDIDSARKESGNG